MSREFKEFGYETWATFFLLIICGGFPFWIMETLRSDGHPFLAIAVCVIGIPAGLGAWAWLAKRL